jgi:hypothetical protein
VDVHVQSAKWAFASLLIFVVSTIIGGIFCKVVYDDMVRNEYLMNHKTQLFFESRKYDADFKGSRSSRKHDQ